MASNTKVHTKFQVGAAVGSGIVARAAEDGGADFLLALNAGRFRNMGASSIACMLPIANATDLTFAFAAQEVLPQSKVPVYLGVDAWSADMEDVEIADRLIETGFAGAVNFPSSMHFSSGMQRLLDRSGLGTRREISMLSAVQARGGSSLFYCDTWHQARLAADAGLDAIVINFGWNVGGAEGHRAQVTLEEAAFSAHEIARAVRRAKSDIKIFLEGGPILTADDLAFVNRQVEIDGYVGGSTIDRFPVQSSIANQIVEYQEAGNQLRPRDTETERASAKLDAFGLVGQSEDFQRFALQLVRYARSRTHLALIGESGTDLVAAVEAILSIDPVATASGTRYYDFTENEPPHRVNEILFGSRREGRSRSGVLSGSDGSLVVLQSCEYMPRLVLQRLSSMLRDGRFHPVGARTRHPLKTRLICMANDMVFLDAMEPEAQSAIQILHYPPLRDRYLDIRALLGRRLEDLGLAGHERPVIQPTAYRVLMSHRWPGNDAELAALARELASRPQLALVEAADIREVLHGASETSRVESVDDMLRQQILQALMHNGFRRGDTARALNISRKTLYNQMRRFGLI